MYITNPCLEEAENFILDKLAKRKEKAQIELEIQQGIRPIPKSFMKSIAGPLIISEMAGVGRGKGRKGYGPM